MRDFSIDIIWAKLQMAIAAVGGWLGYFLGGMDGFADCTSDLYGRGLCDRPHVRCGRQEAVLQRGL